MNKFLGCTLFLILQYPLLWGQLGGEHTYSFLSLETLPEFAALGGSVVTGKPSNALTGLYNPATNSSENHKDIALNYTNYISDINYGAVATTIALKDRYTSLHIGALYLDYGTFSGYDLEGTPTTDFSSKEYAIVTGFQSSLSNTDFKYGVNLKFIHSNLETYTSSALALDLGMSYYNSLSKFSFAFVVRNLGTQISMYENTKETLPLEVNLGASKILKNVAAKWYVNIHNLQDWDLAFSNPNRATEDLITGESIAEDPSFFNNLLRHINLGIEILPESDFNIRLGYNFRRSEELRIVDLRSFSGFSAGFGLKIRRFKLSYAFARYNKAALSSLFGLNIDLSGK